MRGAEIGWVTCLEAIEIVNKQALIRVLTGGEVPNLLSYRVLTVFSFAAEE